MTRAFERPEVLCGPTYEEDTGCGAICLTVNFFKGEPVEVFARVGEPEPCFKASVAVLTTIASHALQAGVPWEKIAKALKGTRCDKPLLREGGSLTSCFDVLGRLLERAVQDNKLEKKEAENAGT